ncbi:lipopolysaccharide biosynthesis protein [Qipengyuania sp. NPDC077410]|uniref:lipopolysaccharide biosynthesis protein n=1 Tax=Qipengyuania sp. NPDC077410 TaxID=3364496 RepID=UPI0037CCAAE2
MRKITVLLSSNAVAAALIAVGTLLLSRIVDPATFGSYSYAAQIAVAIYPVLTLRFEQALPLLGKCQTAMLQMLLGIVWLALLASLLFYLAGIVALYFLSTPFSLSAAQAQLFPIIVLTSLALALVSIYQSASLALGNLNGMAIARVMRAIALVGGQLSLAMLIGGGAVWLLVADLGASLLQALLLAYGVSAAALLQVLRRPIRRQLTHLWILARRHRVFPLITLPHLLVHSALVLLMTTTIGAFYGAAILGQYFLMRKLVFGILALFGTAVYQHAISEAASVGRSEVYLVAKRALIVIGTVTAISSLALLLVGEQLFLLAAGAEWALAGQMAIAILPVILMEPITSTFAFVPVFLGLQRTAFIAAIIQGAVGVGVMALAGAVGWGVLAALFATSLSMSFIMAAYVGWLVLQARRAARGQFS